MHKMNRRRAIKQVSSVMGGALSGSLILGVMSGCKAEVALDWTPEALTPQETMITATLAELILPATSTPGAKEARVERFIDTMIAGYLTEAQRSEFMNGLAKLEKRKFLKKTPAEQREIVAELALEARKQKENSGTKPFFLLAKEMTLLGFFTSEIGATQVLIYDPVPGGYQGCVPLSEVGGKTWAT